MPQPLTRIDVYLEVGKKRTFAGAVDWPGWCRVGRDEASALQALFPYGPRYARVLSAARLGFKAPADASALKVVERLAGDATTDFGAPGIAPSADKRPVDDAELERLQAILKSCWRTFDQAVSAAQGKELRKGPRGGGRDLDKIVEHVLGAEEGYLSRLGDKFKLGPTDDPNERPSLLHQAILDTLGAAARGETPTRGPRGGARWTPRYFVRRSAWHVLDHAWEIQDRAA